MYEAALKIKYVFVRRKFRWALQVTSDVRASISAWLGLFAVN
jgi:hypothetical protein